jgi:chitodextrinase
VTLCWTASTSSLGIAGYLVERCQDMGCDNFTQIATPATTTYNDTALSPGTSYSYRVRAMDTVGNLSLYSNVASATTPDTTPPSVRVTSPANGATVSASVTLAATACDNVGVSTVQFQLDGANLGPALTIPPYLYTWDTTTTGNGAHTLTTIATDTFNNNTASAGAVVTVNNTTGLPPTQGLIGYWNFDEGAGSTAYDTSGSGYNATVNGATWTAGKINSALSFDGTNDVVTPNIALGNAFSISVWVNPAVTPQMVYSRIAETRYDGGLYVGTDSTGTRYQIIVNNGFGSTGSCGALFGCAEGGTVTSGWHLVTATFDGAAANLYVDNALVASDTFTAPGSTDYPLYIGQYYGGSGDGWSGAVDEVRLYNRALTNDEVIAIYNYIGPTGLPPTQGLIGHWNFDEEVGSTAYDTSGSGYNATVNGYFRIRSEIFRRSSGFTDFFPRRVTGFGNGGMATAVR